MDQILDYLAYTSSPTKQGPVTTKHGLEDGHAISGWRTRENKYRTSMTGVREGHHMVCPRGQRCGPHVHVWLLQARYDPEAVALCAIFTNKGDEPLEQCTKGLQWILLCFYSKKEQIV